MNKYLMLFAATLIPTTAWASHATIALSGSACSYWVLDWKENLYGAHIVNPCESSAYAIGIAGYTKNAGKNVNFAFPPHSPYTAISVDLQLPLKTNNAWTAYGVGSGGAATEIASGFYIVLTNDRRNSRSGPSLGTRVKELFGARSKNSDH